MLYLAVVQLGAMPICLLQLLFPMSCTQILDAFGTEVAIYIYIYVYVYVYVYTHIYT